MINDSPGSKLITKTELAVYAHCTPRSIDNWMKRGYLPYFKIGRTVRFKIADVDSYLRAHHCVQRRELPMHLSRPAARTVETSVDLEGIVVSK